MLILKQENLSKDVDKLWIKEAYKRKQDIKEKRISLIDGDKVFEDISKRLTN